MASPVISICIPTYNRSKYLECLLQSLQEQLVDFPYSHEIVISDNASTDGTAGVIASWRDRLPLRDFRQAENRGPGANWQLVMTRARGTYVLYVADDDIVLLPQVAEVVRTMEANPAIAITFAPWLLHDLVAGKSKGTFYTQAQDLLIERGDYLGLLDAMLRWSIFPEICVARRAVFNAVMPRVSSEVFYAFVHAAEFLGRGNVLLRKEPFYVSVTQYFADEPARPQNGIAETLHAWDRYRGGLEHVLSRVGGKVSDMERIGLVLRITEIIAGRMAVAVRLRFEAQKDAVDTYFIASRVCALGYERLLQPPIQLLAARAALWFLATDTELHAGIQTLICVGGSTAEVRDHIRSIARVETRFEATLPALGQLRNCLVFVREPPSLADDERERLLDANVKVVCERDVLAKFPA